MSNPVDLPASSSARRSDVPGAGMRVGDAERADIADRLARHFSDGRLDEAEFSERLDRAMHAKTVADLSGLLSDLPGEDPDRPQPGSRRQQRKLLKVQLERERLRLRHERRLDRRAELEQRWRALRWLPLLVVVIVGTVIAVHLLTDSVLACLAIGLLAFWWMRRGAARGRYSPPPADEPWQASTGPSDVQDGDDRAGDA